MQCSNVTKVSSDIVPINGIKTFEGFVSAGSSLQLLNETMNEFRTIFDIKHVFDAVRSATLSLKVILISGHQMVTMDHSAIVYKAHSSHG